MRLERLRPDHAQALLNFEQENRAYFARSVPDRGDAYFAEFDARHQAILDEQDTGAIHFHLVLDDDGAVLGRVNLVDVADGTAELGYRIAESASGKGVAKAAVREICRLSAETYGLVTLTAVTTHDNPASKAVLKGCGFTAVEDIVADDRPGVRYQLHLPTPSP